ncbi:MAG TPA: ABC transporter substrate-binding protein [Desulfosalsimonadaceae bacterium]|nr:ABC transporter substrate-binding protein [Desulfosalsimonadaceae bacterium]
MKQSIWIIFLVMTIVAAAAGTGVCEEGVTDTEIHIGQWGPQTGPAAPWGAVARGTDAYFKMINANGGIHGRKLVHHFFDDAYNPAKTKAGVKQLQEQTGMFAWVSGVGTAPGLAVKDYLMERKIPWIGPSTGSRHWVEPPQKYLFNVYPLYLGDAQVLTDYAVNELGKKKIAIAYQNDDYGKQGLEGARFTLEKNGMELVETTPVAVTDKDMKPHIMKLKKSDADAVLLFVTPGAVARLIGTGKAMQFNPQWLSTTTCGDFPLMMSITKGLYEGVISASFGMGAVKGHIGEVQGIMEPKLELMKKYKEEAYAKFAAEDERWGYTFCAGFGLAEPLVEALRRCGRDLTREKLVKELEGLKNFKGIMGNITYKPFDPEDPLCRLGQQEVYLQECMADGQSKILTDWRETEYIPKND